MTAPQGHGELGGRFVDVGTKCEGMSSIKGSSASFTELRKEVLNRGFQGYGSGVWVFGGLGLRLRDPRKTTVMTCRNPICEVGKNRSRQVVLVFVEARRLLHVLQNSTSPQAL